MPPRTIPRPQPVRDARRQFAEAIAMEIAIRWRCAWLNLSRVCDHYLDRQAAAHAVEQAVREVRAAGDSARTLGVDCRPLYYEQPPDQRRRIMSIVFQACPKGVAGVPSLG